MNTSHLLLVPGKDRLHDRLYSAQDVVLSFLPSRVDQPVDSLGPGVLLQLPDLSVERHMFLLNVRRVNANNLQDLAAKHANMRIGQDRPLGLNEPLPRSLGTQYIALEDESVHCLRITIHQGQHIKYARLLPLRFHIDTEPARAFVERMR